MTTIPWPEGPMVGFDTESTGVDVETDRVVTAGVIYHVPGHAPTIRNVLINPGVDIPEGATAVHGITTEYAREHGVSPREGIAEILDLLNKSKHLPIVAFNAPYDFTLLDREARRYGLEPFNPPCVIDPFVLDKHLEPYRSGSRKLTDISELYHVGFDNAHSADADALGAILLARAMGQRVRGMAALPDDAAELHALQIGWKIAQQDNFEAYLRRKGKDETLARDWPLVPYPELVDA